jgi:hypothetical protein
METDSSERSKSAIKGLASQSARTTLGNEYLLQQAAGVSSAVTLWTRWRWFELWEEA